MGCGKCMVEIAPVGKWISLVRNMEQTNVKMQKHLLVLVNVVFILFCFFKEHTLPKIRQERNGLIFSFTQTRRFEILVGVSHNDLTFANKLCLVFCWRKLANQDESSGSIKRLVFHGCLRLIQR